MKRPGARISKHLTRGAEAMFVGALLLSGGCGTLATKTETGFGEVYSGTSCSAGATSFTAGLTVMGAWPLAIVVPFAAIDTVLSAVADTLLLPFDLPAKAPLIRGKGCYVPDHMSSAPTKRQTDISRGLVRN